MIRKITLVLSLVFLWSLSFSQVVELRKTFIDSIFGNKNEVIFKFKIKNKQEIETLTRIISIDNVQGYEVTAYANKSEFTNFLSMGYKYTVINKSTQNEKLYTMATTVAQMATWDRYPTYSVYEQMMLQFQTNYPNLCNLDTILSPTPNGHRILVVKISDNVNLNENEPHFLYSSSMHGDETTGYALMLRLIDYLLSNYGSNSKVTNLVNNAEIWICPLANPDGTYHSGDNTINATSSTRYNAYSVDLNRNYPDPRTGPHPDGNAWQPETQAFMSFADNHYFNASANFHGGAEVYNYPWDTWITSGNPNADANWWIRMGKEYVDTSRIYYSNYMTSVISSGYIEGGDWYVITGGRQDYMNFFKHCREVTIEIDNTKTTQTQNLPARWNYNYRSMLNYIQESLYGIRGLVTDSCTGLPLKAKVWVNNYDQNNDSSFVYSNPTVGNYHRYLNTGTYSLTYSATGYTSKTITGISLTNGSATVVNVPLAPIAPSASFTYSVIAGAVNFTNTSSGGTAYSWNFGDGGTSTAQNPAYSYTSSGNYTVVLTTFNECVYDTAIAQISVTITDIDETSKDYSVDVYPNPSNGNFNLVIMAGDDAKVKMMIVDVFGNIVKEAYYDLQIGENNFSFDQTKISNGMYYLMIETPEGIRYGKVLLKD